MDHNELSESFFHNKYKLVKVQWVDAETRQGWENQAEVDTWIEKVEPVISYGLWVGLGDAFLVLAGDRGDIESKMFNRFMKIPVKWMVDLTVV